MKANLKFLIKLAYVSVCQNSVFKIIIARFLLTSNRNISSILKWTVTPRLLGGVAVVFPVVRRGNGIGKGHLVVVVKNEGLTSSSKHAITVCLSKQLLVKPDSMIRYLCLNAVCIAYEKQEASIFRCSIITIEVVVCLNA